MKVNTKSGDIGGTSFVYVYGIRESKKSAHDEAYGTCVMKLIKD